MSRLSYILLIFFMGYVSPSLALNMFQCRPIDGVAIYTQEYSGDISESINKPGGIAKDFFEFNSGGGKVPRECKCRSYDRDDSTWYDTTFFTATTPLTHSTHNGIQYLDLNEYLSVAMYYWIGKRNVYLDVPFTNEKNTYQERCVDGWMTNLAADTGAKGKIDIRIKKQIIGSTQFHGLVSTLYASLKNSVSSPDPIAQTYLDLTVNTPAFCSIDEGSTINIDLGEVVSSDLNYGKEPTGYTKRDLNLTFRCNFDGQLDLTLLGKSSSLPEFFATSNSEIGIAIERNGSLVKPNEKGNSVPLDGSHVGHFDAKTYPVKTNNSAVLPDNYTGSINVLVEVL